MKTAQRIAVVAALLLVVLAGAQTAGAQAAKRAVTWDDMIAMHRVGDAQISPDGKWVAYQVTTPDKEANRNKSNIWIVAVAGGEPRQLTRGGSDQRPRWSPDGKRLAFLSSRDGTPQVYTMWLSGGEAMRFTSLSTGADNELWSPDGKWMAFVSNVYPDCADDACNQKRNEDKEKSKVKARIYEKLLYRHWTQWWDGTRSHLFVQALDGGAARDLTPNADYDVPPFNLGDPEAIGWAPDSSELCFTANTEKDEAISTNGDLFTVPVTGASAPARITTNPGNDWGPVYSPDGKWIAYRAQTINGYESDRFRLMLYDRATHKHINRIDGFDNWVDSIGWSPDSQWVYFDAQDQVAIAIYRVKVEGNSSQQTVVKEGAVGDFSVSPDGHTVVFTRSRVNEPAEVFAVDVADSRVRQLTHHNSALLAQLDMAPAELFWFTGADNTQVQGLLVKPPNFDATKKYPMLLAVHGGPQGAWEDGWGYRWNQEVFASPGYVVVTINPHGSTGYGQKFTAEISGDWGGMVFEDLMKGVDFVVAKYPYIDGTRLAAAGGSYGGYMVNWMASQSKGRFKCLISHAGPFDAISMYGATEELWFEEWDQKGTPWANRENYEKWDPSRFAGELGKYKTPTLVIGGELDFRVPYTQDLEYFTALQRQGVPSKLVIFPDEGHWILKPQNSELWYKLVLGWLATYLK